MKWTNQSHVFQTTNQIGFTRLGLGVHDFSTNPFFRSPKHLNKDHNLSDREINFIILRIPNIILSYSIILGIISFLILIFYHTPNIKDIPNIIFYIKFLSYCHIFPKDPTADVSLHRMSKNHLPPSGVVRPRERLGGEVLHSRMDILNERCRCPSEVHSPPMSPWFMVIIW